MNFAPEEFKNVTLYTPGNVIWTNIIRLDVSWARIQVKPYAQYKECVYAEFLQLKKRKPEALVSRYMVVVPTGQAIQPDDLFLPPVNGVSENRYGVGDPRWITDFEEQLRNAKVPILADYRELGQEAEITTPLSPTEPIAPVIDLSQNEGSPDHRRAYEEGIRYQAERSFFLRNPQLIADAKREYGCICQVCRFDFAENYGDLGRSFIEMHHLNPLSERPQEEWTDVIRTDLSEVSVLCANCHRMIHRRRPALSLEQLRIAYAAAKQRKQ